MSETNDPARQALEAIEQARTGALSAMAWTHFMAELCAALIRFLPPEIRAAAESWLTDTAATMDAFATDRPDGETGHLARQKAIAAKTVLTAIRTPSLAQTFAAAALRQASESPAPPALHREPDAP